MIKIGQSSHKMYSNNILNFQESMTILNACIKKKSLETYRMHLVSFLSVIILWVFVTFYSQGSLVEGQDVESSCHLLLLTRYFGLSLSLCTCLVFFIHYAFSTQGSLVKGKVSEWRGILVVNSRSHCGTFSSISNCRVFLINLAFSIPRTVK